MRENETSNYNGAYEIYADIQTRTKGDIYIGVVGPVRTGKSTFIKRFMDLMVLPNMEDEHEKKRAQDELPQSAGGKTITTTEPKFIPKEAANLQLADDVDVRVRLIDCVGFMVEGAGGHMEEDTERLVKTPWFEEEIPFTQAAEIGTQKVINDHSTIGIVITTDGSFSELSRSAYTEPEERTIKELKLLHKPFLVLLNSNRPLSEETKALAKEISDKYQVRAIPINCEQLKREDINRVLEEVLYEFPISKIEFYMPKWVEMLPIEHKMKQDILEKIKEFIADKNCMRDITGYECEMASEYIKRMKTEQISMADGTLRMMLDVNEGYYYEMISDILGEKVTGEYQLLKVMKELCEMKKEYSKVENAISSVRYKGYGVVTPERSEIRLENPELIKHGNKYGVKITAFSPSIHMIKADIESEISPIVGSEEQANDLIRYIKEEEDKEDGIWDTNIFGKTVEQLVNDGISAKISMIGEESQIKLQETMQKIVNESNGGMVCIII